MKMLGIWWLLFSPQRSDERFHLLYSRATAIASKVGVSPTKPRTVNRQVNRANANVGGDIESELLLSFHCSCDPAFE